MHDFLVKVVNRSYINVMRIREKLISYVKWTIHSIKISTVAAAATIQAC